MDRRDIKGTSVTKLNSEPTATDAARVLTSDDTSTATGLASAMSSSSDTRLADEVDGLVAADFASRSAKSRERGNGSCAFLFRWSTHLLLRV
jgi:hypothetical protein